MDTSTVVLIIILFFVVIVIFGIGIWAIVSSQNKEEESVLTEDEVFLTSDSKKGRTTIKSKSELISGIYSIKNTPGKIIVEHDGKIITFESTTYLYITITLESNGQIVGTDDKDNDAEIFRIGNADSGVAPYYLIIKNKKWVITDSKSTVTTKDVFSLLGDYSSKPTVPTVPKYFTFTNVDDKSIVFYNPDKSLSVYDKDKDATVKRKVITLGEDKDILEKNKTFYVDKKGFVRNCIDDKFLMIHKSDDSVSEWVDENEVIATNKIILKNIDKTKQYVLMNESKNIIITRSKIRKVITYVNSTNAPKNLAETTNLQRWTLTSVDKCK